MKGGVQVIMTESELKEMISDVKLFFETTVIPEHEIRLNECTVISDIPKFLSSRLCIEYSEKGVFIPSLERLILLRHILETNGIHQIESRTTDRSPKISNISTGEERNEDKKFKNSKGSKQPENKITKQNKELGTLFD